MIIKVLKRENEKMTHIFNATNSHLALKELCARLGVQPCDLQIDVVRIGGDCTNTQINVFFASDRKRTQPIGQLMIYA